MVKKLFKHEIQAYVRTIIPMHLVLLGIALMGRFVQIFENDSDAYLIVFYSSVIAFIIGAVVCLLLTTFFGIKRFYSNLFSHEGYLSFTLPVTSTQHIMVKNIVATLFQVLSVIMILICTCAITMGDVCIELFKAGGYLIKVLHEVFGFHATLFILEGIINFIFAISSGMMIYYACIAIGQRAKKNRVAAAIGVYFIYYLICQVIGTIFVVVVTVFYEPWNIEQFLMYLADDPIFTNHLTFVVGIVISAILFVVGFVITKCTIDRKLNLE